MGLNAGYFRYPSVAGDTVVFVSEDDAWTVPLSGGVAQRLTANLGEVSRPVLSPDGSQLALVSREEHHAEVYVMPGGGGPATRLTWLGANTVVRGWLPDGRILFVSDAEQAFTSQLHAYAISPDGGQPELLPYGPAREVAFGPGGAIVLGRNTADPARWKRYRGGTAGELWVDQRGNGQFKRLVQLQGNLAAPMWIGKRVFFLSDHEGVGNVYSCRPDGRDITRHTDHDNYYARFAQTDGTTIVYQHAAEIWRYDPEADEAAVVEVDFRSPRVQRNRKFVPADRYLAGAALHPKGHSVAIETRGKLFTMPLWEEAVHQHGRPDGVRYRLARWTGDGKAMVAVSDEDGEDAIEVTRPGQDDVKRLSGIDLGLVVDIATAPDGDKVAVANQRHELLLVDIGTGTAKKIDQSEGGGLDGLTWSNDGGWIAYSFATSGRTRIIKLCEVATGKTHAVTRPEYRDFQPSFDPGGKYLYFLSARVFDPVYDTIYFDLGFPKGVKPYLVTLRTDVPSPFVAKPKGLGGEEPGADAEGDGDKASAKKKDDKKKDTPEPLRIDLDGLADRVISVPVPEDRYFRVVGIEGKILFASIPVSGSLGSDWSSGGGGAFAALEVYDLAELHHDTLVNGIGDLVVSRDGSALLYSAGNRLRVIKAGEKPADGSEHEPPGRKSGWLDLDRIKVSVDPVSEWRQMFLEAWRLQREHFWMPDMSGVDWPTVRDRYLPLVEKVGSRAEFSDLMWETQGELGTSHAYEMGGDYRPAPAYALGLLGADLRLEGGRWTFAHIVKGDSWEDGQDSPLHAPGINVREGDTLLAVGGRAVGRDVHPNSLLVNQPGMAVELTVGDARGRKPRTVIVTTLRSDTPARYREWVSRNRAYVAEKTGGRVGYVHIPDMSPHGYSEFHRSYHAEIERDALVVDVRFNGGGHVSQLILEKLARKRIGYDIQRWGPPEPYPEASPAGPMVAITNEWAGSDGDIFTHCFKLLSLGPVVGKRTWGGVIGINPSHVLADGSMTTQPEYSFWFSDVGWGVENYGTDPDYDVDIKPQDYAAGVDPQLDKAIELVQRALRSHKPLTADVRTRPNLALPLLPPRGAAAASTNGSARAKTPKAAARRSRRS
ncbi:MAG: PDZ domain-containing protein [Actinobacteria bacterium]|nr:PDZ domain-containing protein [Actinomycetota bacterium]